jgi:hypothetical protein
MNGCITFCNEKRWYVNGILHREDGPAVEYADGSRAWHQNYKLHRYDGPAIEHCNGSRAWYIKGRLHRRDGPAIDLANGTQFWVYDGKKDTREKNCARERDRIACCLNTYSWLPIETSGGRFPLLNLIVQYL